jgi:hypothetical protein
MKKFYLLILCFISISTLAQQITFNKSFGNGNSIIDTGRPIVEIPGVGYLVPNMFWKYWNDSSRIVITLIDYNGNVIINKFYGEDGKVYDCAKVIKLHDDNYLFLGVYRLTFNNNLYSFVYKLNSLGDTLWSKTYSSGQMFTLLEEVIETKDKGFLMTGWSQNFSGPTYYQSQAYIVKTDSLGNVEWDYLFGNSIDYERGTAIHELSDSSIIIVGYKYVPAVDQNQSILIKIDKNGNYIDDNLITSPVSIAFTNSILGSDGYIYVTGSFDVSGIPFKSKGLVGKFDSSLNLIWQDTIGHSGFQNEVFFGITESLNHQIIVCGGTSYLNATGAHNGWVASFDTSGNTLWERVLFKNNKSEWFNTVIQVSDGGYAMCGSVQIYDSTAGSWSQDVWVVKVDSLGCDIDGCPTILWTSVKENELIMKNNLKVYPNPFSDNLNISFTLDTNKEIKIELFNSLGQVVKTISNKRYFTGKNEINFSIAELPECIYHLKFSAGDEIVVKRIVKM